MAERRKARVKARRRSAELAVRKPMGIFRARSGRLRMVMGVGVVDGRKRVKEIISDGSGLWDALKNCETGWPQIEVTGAETDAA